MRIDFGFFFSPLLPSLALALVLQMIGIKSDRFTANGGSVELGDTVLVLFCSLLVCYALIFVVIRPLYLRLAQSRNIGFQFLAQSGLLIGMAVGGFLVLGSVKHLFQALLAVLGFGLFGASIAGMFWIIALSPIAYRIEQRMIAQSSDSQRMAGKKLVRIVKGFLLAPLLPCFGFSVLLLPLFPIVFLLSLGISYGVILFLAAPLYFYLSRSIRLSERKCVVWGFLLGCVPGLAHIYGYYVSLSDADPESGLFLTAGALLGACTGFMFSLIALSPVTLAPINKQM